MKRLLTSLVVCGLLFLTTSEPKAGLQTGTSGGSLNGNTITAGTGTLTLGTATLNAGGGGTLGTNAFTSTTYAPLASPTFTGTVTYPTPFTLGAISVTATGTELNYVAGVTSSIQTQLAGKQASGSYALSGANGDILSLSGLTTALSVAQGGTGITSFGSGVATFLGTPSSANLRSALTDENGTGAALFDGATSPTFVTPLLGTPTSGTLTNCTLPVGGVTGLGTGVGTFLATPSSANLAATVTDETGSGLAVFATSPSLTTPTIGAATATSVTLGGGGAMTGTSGAVTLTASGTNQNITLTPSGTGVTEQRNGTTAQTFNIYHTYTDASNYRRLRVQNGANFVQLNAEGVGTGVNNSLYFNTASTNTGYMSFRTQDNERWNITSAGHFLAGADNTYDIGASGATRPRDLFLGRNATIAGNIALPTTTTTVGQLTINSVLFGHNFGSADNTFYGGLSGNTTNSTATENTGIGYNTLNALSTGDQNVAVGSHAGEAINTGTGNTVIGRYAGPSLGSAGNVVAIGNQVLYSNNSSNNTVVGAFGFFDSTASGNTYNTGLGLSVGHGDVGVANTTGTKNTLLGAFANTSASSTTEGIAIGYNAVAASNKVSFGGTGADAVALGTFNGITAAGVGFPLIVKATRVTAQSAANSSIATYTTPATDGSYEISMNMNVTAATALSTSLNCDYTDESNTARTMIFPVTGLTGSFLAGGLVTATGAFETPVMHIRTKASTAITLYTAAGTFTSVTYTAEGIIKQMQ